MFDRMSRGGKDYLLLGDIQNFISSILPSTYQRSAISMALDSFRIADSDRDGRIS